MGCVYLITSPSGKQYVGMTTRTLEQRWSEHIRYSKKRECTLHHALCKYDFDSFQVVEQFYSDDLNQLREKEKELIARLKPAYNMTAGGEGTNGYRWSEKLKKTQGKKHSKRYEDNPELRKRQSLRMRNREVKEETKQKIREANMGKSLSSSTRAKIGVKSKENWQNPEYQKVQTTKAKANWQNPEYQKKMQLRARPPGTPCLIDGIKFDFVVDASRAHGVTPETVRNRIRSEKFLTWKFCDT